MSTTTGYQDGAGRRGSNLLLSSLVVLLAAMVLSTSAQRNTAQQRNDVTYAEINKLMPKCHPRDTCSVARKEDDAVNHFCHCNSYCTMFDTCCVDSQYRNVAAPKLTPHTCAQVYNNRSRRVYMIDKCMRNWNDEYVKEKCLGDGDKRSDPLLMIPVTNRRSGITYKNYFCAACNGEDKRRGDIVFWHMGVFLNRTSGSAQSSRISRSELLRMRYRNDKWEIRGGQDVHTVWFELDIPSSITQHVKFCEKVISTCLADWKGDVTKAKCASYMAIVGAEHGAVNKWGTRYKRFRNLHCALCNRVPMDTLDCEVPIDTYPPERTPFNIGFLVDINRADGDVPGRRRRCRTRQIFDPVKQTCVRSAGCFAGHVLRNGQCFRVTSG